MRLNEYHGMYGKSFNLKEKFLIHPRSGFYTHMERQGLTDNNKWSCLCGDVCFNREQLHLGRQMYYFFNAVELKWSIKVGVYKALLLDLITVGR